METVTATVRFVAGGQPLEASITVPNGPVHPGELLPVFRSLADQIVDAGERSVAGEGKQISCKAGCGACCRQLVPITKLEARRLLALVNAMPEPRRTAVLRRFDDARAHFANAGILDALLNPESIPGTGLRPFGLRYFAVGVPCPFLEDESCSIHPERPIACREYLVTSPAENCKSPSAESIRMVPIAAKVSNAVARLDETAGESTTSRWVPLAVALEWTESHADDTRLEAGPVLIQRLFSHLAPSKRSAASTENTASTS